MRTTRVQTSDADEARARVADLFCEHRLEPAGRVVDVELSAYGAGGAGVVHLDYGVRVDIDPVTIDDFYLVQVPRGGSAKVRVGRSTVIATARTASILSPGEPVRMTWAQNSPHLCVYLSRSLVEGEAARLLGGPTRIAPVFEAAWDLTSDAAASWLRAVDFLAGGLAEGDPLLTNDACAQGVARTLASGLLLAHRHSMSEAAAGRAALAGRGSIRAQVVGQATEYVVRNLGASLTVGELAEAAGVGVRTLQDAFRAELDTTPSSYVRSRRLRAAREALLAADPDHTTVTDVALAVGLTHLGRFAVQYGKEYGEAPSVTLRSGS